MTVSFLRRRWRPVQNDFELALRMIAVQDNGGQDAMSPRTLHESVHRRLAAIEPVPLAFGRLRDKRFEIAEVIVDDAIHLTGVGRSVVGLVMSDGAAPYLAAKSASGSRRRCLGGILA